MPAGSERPIAFASRTMTKAEKNYAQIEKEALGIIFSIKKFHQYIYVYGKKFTDHKPLTTILSPKASLPALRIQKWAYNYGVVFCRTEEHLNADGHPIVESDTTDKHPVTEASLFRITQTGVLPVKPENVQQRLHDIQC